MLKLMKLEIKKFNLWNYWKAVSICNISFIALLCMMYFILMYEGEVLDLFGDFDTTATFIGTMVRITFTIFASVLISRLIIDEYKSKSIAVMFTYPINRKKIISAKLAIVFSFTFTMVVISTLFLEGLVLLADLNFNIFPGEIQLPDTSAHVLNVFMNALATAGISLIPLLVGMHRKSAPATIVSSILIAALLNSQNGDAGFSLFSIIAIPLLLGLLGLFIGYYSIRNIEEKDLV